jgi:hypothetical protein
MSFCDTLVLRPAKVRWKFRTCANRLESVSLRFATDSIARDDCVETPANLTLP